MNQVFQKIIDDTLKEPNGKWSKKGLTMFTAYVCGIVSGFYIIFKYESNAFEVFVVFMLMATGQSILAYKEKKNELNKDNNETQQD